MTEPQVDIKTASYRIIHESPAHITYGVWINGGKAGNLVVRQDEKIAFQEMMERAGFVLTIPGDLEGFLK